MSLLYDVPIRETLSNAHKENCYALRIAHYPARDCLQSLRQTIATASFDEPWRVKMMRRFIKKYVFPLVIGYIKHEDMYLWKYAKDKFNLQLHNTYNSEFIDFLIAFEHLNECLNQKHWDFCEFKRVSLHFYECAIEYLICTERYMRSIQIREWANEDPSNISKLIENMFSPYFKKHKAIMMPIFYYKVYRTTNEHKDFIKDFPILTRWAFWLHHVVVYRKKYLRWISRIQINWKPFIFI